MIQSVVAGHTPIAFSSLPPAAAQIQAGTLRALAVTAEKRIDSLPDVPTMAEAGYPGQIGETPIGIFVPAGTPKAIVDSCIARWSQIVAHARRQGRSSPRSASRRSATRRRSSPRTSRPSSAKWGKVIRDAGIKVAIALGGTRSPRAPAAAAPRRGSTAARRRS